MPHPRPGTLARVLVHPPLKYALCGGCCLVAALGLLDPWSLEQAWLPKHLLLNE